MTQTIAKDELQKKLAMSQARFEEATTATTTAMEDFILATNRITAEIRRMKDLDQAIRILDAAEREGIHQA